MITDRMYRLLRPLPRLHAYYARLVRRLPHRQRIVEHFDLKLSVDPSELSGFHLYYEQEYDDRIFRFLRKHLDRSLWALDLGANIGVYTTFLARECFSVDAFEPDQALAIKLERNLKLNGIDNVVIHTSCISDKTGEVLFEMPPDANLGLGRIHQKGVSVPAISLDDFLSGSSPRPMFIKMDIEGAEWLAIKGAQSMLHDWSQSLAMLIELHPDHIGTYGGSLEALQGMLESSGLKVQALDAEDLISPTKTSRFWWITNRHAG